MADKQPKQEWDPDAAPNREKALAWAAAKKAKQPEPEKK